MTKTVMLGIAAAALLLVGTLAHPRPAHACSAGEDFDPLDGLDLIVTGYATNVTLVRKQDESWFLVVDVEFEVDRYLVGSGPANIVLTDARSASAVGLARNSSQLAELDLSTVSIDELIWDGSSGSCGALDSDPRGQYWVVGATRLETGELSIHRFSLFAVGAGPDDHDIIDRVAVVEGLIADAGIRPANAGNLGIGEPPRTATARGVLLLLSMLLGIIPLRVRSCPRGGS